MIGFTKTLVIVVAAIAASTNMDVGQAQSVDKHETNDPVILIEMAQTSLLQNDYTRAGLIADQAISEAPHSPFAFHIRGKVFHANFDFKKAAEDLLTAYNLYNYRAKLHFEKYEMHSGAGEHFAANADLNTYTSFTNSALAVLGDLEKVDARLPVSVSSRPDDSGQVAASTPPAPIEHARPAMTVTR